MRSPTGPDGPTPALPDLPPFDPNDRYQEFIPQPLPHPHGKLWVQFALLALTLGTTTFAGGCHYAFFELGFNADAQVAAQRLEGQFAMPSFYAHGLWYSLTILAILGCHEMGHYIACLRYNVLATRPFFLPAPLITGTLGAFIRIKSRIPNKIALFDIGVAGPLAGFVIAVPALFIGMMLSRIEQLPLDRSNLQELGEPLLFKFAAWLVWGSVADGYSINMHPMAFAAWFGLLATALNLFPIGQLDGGHISYAVLGRRSTVVTLVMIGVAIGLCFVSNSWIIWTALLVVMTLLLGPNHPPTLHDDEPLGKGRLLIAALAMVILTLCFTPVPLADFISPGP